MNCLVLVNVRLAPPFDGITREGERRAGEADERDRGGKRAPRLPHRVEDIAELGLDVERREPVDIGRVRDRPVDDRPFAGGEAQPQAQRLEGQEDIGEQDRGVDAQPGDRLERYGRRERGIVTEIEDGVTLAEFAVLRHVASGLSHEPHRRDVGALPTARFKKPQARAPRGR